MGMGEEGGRENLTNLPKASDVEFPEARVHDGQFFILRFPLQLCLYDVGV